MTQSGLRAYDTHLMGFKLLTFLVWLAVGGSAVAWAVPWIGRGQAVTPVPEASATAHESDAEADWGPLLMGHSDVAPAALPGLQASRFQLVGVAGPLRASQQGVALLSIDGKPARAFRPGQAIDESLAVLEITANVVKIGLRGQAPAIVLQAPALPPPATGVLADPPGQPIH